jgi:hypothetical protein
VRGHAPSGGLAEVAPQMPPVGDLDRLGSADPGALGIERGPVLADDLDARPLRRPRGQRGGLPGGQHIQWPAGFAVDEHGPVDPAPAERELVQPTTRGCVACGSGRSATTRNSVLRLTVIPIRSAGREPSRPARASPNDPMAARNRSVQRPWRRVSPAICSAHASDAIGAFTNEASHSWAKNHTLARTL